MHMMAVPLSALAAADWLWIGTRLLVAGFGLLLVTGTLLSLTRLTGWFARMWDFPRLQIAGLAVACAIVELALAKATSEIRWFDWMFLLLMAIVTAWQAWRIHEYTPLAPVEVKEGHGTIGSPNVLRIVISNVLESNRQFDRWKRVVKAQNPDLIIAAEVDEAWVRELQSELGASHPHNITQPQGNFYGMGLWSRLPLYDARVEFLVQQDVPSIHATLRLPDGTDIRVHSLHPRPPTPQEQDSSGPRDAELVLVGKQIRQERDDGTEEPTIVVGDLNDVAWSRTTKLFQKLSGLLDPRRGRGFYNTYSANSRWLRFPLDHVFISREFRLIDLRVLEHVGSDHFPVCITVSFEPELKAAQPEPQADAQDHKEAQERLQEQARS